MTNRNDKAALRRELFALVKLHAQDIVGFALTLVRWIVRVLACGISTGIMVAVIAGFYLAVREPAELILTIKALQTITPEQLAPMASNIIGGWVRVFLTALFMTAGLITMIAGRLYVPLWPKRYLVEVPTRPIAVANPRKSVEGIPPHPQQAGDNK